MSARRSRIFAEFDRESARKIAELMRWRWPPDGKPPVFTEEQRKAGMQETERMIRYATMLGEVRYYLDRDKSKPPSHKVRSYLRWQAVVEARQEGRKRQPRKATWPDAYDEAKTRLEGGPAAGEARTMKRAYQEIERLRRAAKVGPSSAT
jgi:hypothetical protein